MDSTTPNQATFSSFNLLKNKQTKQSRRTFLCGLYSPLLLSSLEVQSLESWTLLISIQEATTNLAQETGSSSFTWQSPQKEPGLEKHPNSGRTLENSGLVEDTGVSGMYTESPWNHELAGEYFTICVEAEGLSHSACLRPSFPAAHTGEGRHCCYTWPLLQMRIYKC